MNFHCSKELCDDTIIWKFISVERLIEILANRKLYFTRTDKQSDNSEGFAPFQQIDEYECDFAEENGMYDEISNIIEFIEDNKEICMASLIGIGASLKQNESTHSIGEAFLKLVMKKVKCVYEKEILKLWNENKFVGYTELRIEDVLSNLDAIREELNYSELTEKQRSLLKETLRHSTYLCCWNAGDDINNLLWAYAKGNYGVAMESTIGLLKKNAVRHCGGQSNFEFFLASVDYDNNPDYLVNEFGVLEVSLFDDEKEKKQNIEFFKKALLCKKMKFQAEKEVRLVAIEKNCCPQDEINMFIDFDLDLIKAIHINPGLNPSRAKTYKENLAKLFKNTFENFDDKLIVFD